MTRSRGGAADLGCGYCYTGAKFKKRMPREIAVKGLDLAFAGARAGVKLVQTVTTNGTLLETISVVTPASAPLLGESVAFLFDAASAPEGKRALPVVR